MYVCCATCLDMMSLFNATLTLTHITLHGEKPSLVCQKKRNIFFLFCAHPIFAKCVSLSATCFIELCEVTLERVLLRKQDKVSFTLNV